MNIIGINKTPTTSALKHRIISAAFCLTAGLMPLSAKSYKPDILQKRFDTEQPENNSLNTFNSILGGLLGALAGLTLTRISRGRNYKYSKNAIFNILTGSTVGALFPVITGITTATGLLGFTVSNQILPAYLIKERTDRLFLQTYSEEEAKKIQEKYSALLKTTNKDEYIDNLFKELCKDFKLDNLPIKLNKEYKGNDLHNTENSAIEFDYDRGYTIGINKDFDKISLLKHLTHAIRHIKQDAIIFCTSAPEELFNINFCLLKDEEEKKQIIRTPEARAYEALFLTNQRINFYKKYNMEPDSIDKKNNLYEYGRTILNSIQYYVNNDKKSYTESYFEKDATDTELLMKRFATNSLY